MRTHRPSTRAADAQLVRAARAVVRENLWQLGPEFGVSDVADSCGVSPRRLQRAFYRESEESPETFQAMVASERMSAACRLLRSRRRISVREVVRRVGYRDVAQFTRAYRERFGVTPAEERSAAGGRWRGGRPGGAAVSGRTRRELRARLAREAQYRDADIRSTIAIYGLNETEAEMANEIADTRGLSALHRWAQNIFRGRLAVEDAEWRRRMVMLETSVILQRRDRLDPWLAETGDRDVDVA